MIYKALVKSDLYKKMVREETEKLIQLKKFKMSFKTTFEKHNQKDIINNKILFIVVL